MKRILLTGGGTGGHLFPGIALAEALVQLDVACPVFLDHDKAMEQRILDETSFERIRAPWSGGGRIASVVRIGAALKLLKRERIDGVIALGAQPGFAPGIAASWQGKPLFVLEQNRVVGLANRFLTRWARKVFLSCPVERQSRLLRSRGAVLGCPIRPEFVPTEMPVTSKPELLIFGGSQGSSSVNDVLLEVAGHFHQPDRFRVHHVCGPGNEEGVERSWQQLGVEARVSPFLTDPASALISSSLVLGRSGGSTIAELSAVGRPALLWPYPHHRDRHQLKNAQYLEQNGAAMVVSSDDPRQIAVLIEDLVRDVRRLHEMARCCRELGQPASAYRIAEVIAVHLGVEPACSVQPQVNNITASGEEVMT
ncbi:MAG: glycosyltransferase [Planctomycetota bacterium]|nr:glycosyltransferase [Planctomycetota bacterium]